MRAAGAPTGRCPIIDVDPLVRELAVISGRFFDYELPRERQFLFRYFRTKIERHFIHYLYCVGRHDLFPDHTGLRCQQRWLKMLKTRHDVIISAHTEAKSNLDFDLLMLIEKGRCRPPGYV